MLRRIVPYILAILALATPLRGQDQGTGEVTVKAQWVGVGGRIRPGDWTGIRLLLSDSGDRSREVLVRMAIPDADGDRVIYERATTTNPGVPQPLWMYLRVPMRFRSGDTLNIYVHEALERSGGAGAPGEREGWGAGRVLGSTKILSTRNDLSDATMVFVSPVDGMIGVVGSQRMGLGAYEGESSASSAMPYGHEKTAILDGLTPEALPDRWLGYAPFDAIVWNEPPPASLGTERAQALKEWVLRGGHLVVVLPRIGETWTNEASNPLYDITPPVRVIRHEAVDLNPLKLLFTRKLGTLVNKGEILQTFVTLPGADPSEAVCILRGPAPEGTEGECVVVRRSVGCGAVTLVGLDASSNFMRRNGGKGITLPEAELFWHRVLGKRGRVTMPEDETSRFSGFVGRDDLPLDGDISAQIAKTGVASSGVFAGFVVFVAYWLVAGPLGYAVLSRTGRKKHAWVAFVLASGVFTAIAWGGARAIRPGSVETSHLTFIDHVFGQEMERARSWVSLLIPEYGTATVSVGDPTKAADSPGHDAIVPWDSEESGGEGFPDSRTYRIECRDPRRITIPTRATVKQFQIDWSGGTGWQMPRPEPRPDGTPGALRVVETPEERVKRHVEGSLVHQLPGTLTNVYIVVNFGQRDIARAFTGSGAANTTANVEVYALPGDGEWIPGEPLDLGAILTERVTDAFGLFTAGAGRVGGNVLDPSPRRVALRMAALAFYSQLNPPAEILNSRFGGNESVAARRRFSHGYDLGRWFTQPSVMIVGQLTEGSPSPVPVFVSTGGAFRESPSKGRTVVRWVYPLPEAPPAFTLRTDEGSAGDATPPEPEAENP